MAQRVNSTLATLDKRVKDTTDSIISLRLELESTEWKSTHVSQIEGFIRTMEKCANARETLKQKAPYEDLDKEGTHLWNLAIGSSADTDTQKDITLYLRILAFFMLDCTELSSERSWKSTSRLLKLALRIGKMCTEHRETMIWEGKIMEKGAKYLEDLAQSIGQLPTEDQKQYDHFSCNYFTLRMAMAWKQSNLSAAEYMFNKALTSLETDGECIASEALAQVAFEIGNGLCGQKVYDAAIKWIKRSFDILNKIDPICLSEQGSDRRFAVMHSLASACIQNKEDGDFDRARATIDMMFEDGPTKVVTYLLRLELITAETPDAFEEEYYAVLMKMINIVIINEPTFKTILGKIHFLAQKSPKLAGSCLDELIVKCLVPLEKDDWIETAFVTRFWMQVRSASTDGIQSSTLGALKSVLESLSKYFIKPLSIKSTNSIQTLIWKATEGLLTQNKYEDVISLCELATHKIFNRTGDLNHGKLSRRIMHCCIQLGDCGKASDVYETMSEASKKHPSSLFLLYKVALRTFNYVTAENCLRGICEAQTADFRALYACVLEAETAQDKDQTFKVLMHILKYVDDLPPDSLHIPAAFRCVVRLNVEKIKREEGEELSNIDSLCKVIDMAYEQAKRSRAKKGTNIKPESAFTLKELEWFIRVTYNLGLRSIEEWSPPTSIRIIGFCVKFLDLFPDDVDHATRNNITLRASYCHFICASLHTDLARGEDNIETQLQHFLDVKRHVERFRAARNALEGKVTEEESWDLKDRLSTLLQYDFEASIHLKNWDCLTSIVSEAEQCENSSTVQYFGDMILKSTAPDRTIMPLLKKILEAIISRPNEKIDVQKLARCVRCQVQLSLIKDPRIMESLLSQVLSFVREKRGEKYPIEELKWLASTAWNRAIDFRSLSDSANYEVFAALALDVAKCIEGGETFLKRLQKKYLDASNVRDGKSC
ncbi:meiosis protein SPO22/ZIP4 like-domain-containing protein [Peziza echinospora]|nr:meiosis protein SPO22/ZIP4 like-domain-containing protein [Peziza echinospora]